MYSVCIMYTLSRTFAQHTIHMKSIVCVILAQFSHGINLNVSIFIRNLIWKRDHYGPGHHMVHFHFVIVDGDG